MATLVTFPYRTIVEVSTRALIKNLFTLRSRTQKEVIPVIKADAYGHGMLPVARSLVQKGFVECLAVATLEEALELRKKLGGDVSILVLSGFAPHQLEAYLKYRITPVIHTLNHLKSLLGRDKLPPLHLKIDSGMHRLGVVVEEFPEVIKILKKLPEKLSGLMTHFAESENTSSVFIDKQIKEFETLFFNLREQKLLLTDARIHVGNSGGALRGKVSVSNSIRPGLALFGLSPNPHWDIPELIPILTWKTRVLSIKTLKRGDTVGYGRTYKASKKEKIAILAVGYADGFPRALSNKGQVLLSGRRVPIRGRVSMDMIAVDVTSIAQVREGMVATIIGKEGKYELTAWDHAIKSETIPYEVLCGLSQRVPRIYLE